MQTFQAAMQRDSDAAADIKSRGRRLTHLQDSLGEWRTKLAADRKVRLPKYPSFCRSLLWTHSRRDKLQGTQSQRATKLAAAAHSAFLVFTLSILQQRLNEQQIASVDTNAHTQWRCPR